MTRPWLLRESTVGGEKRTLASMCAKIEDAAITDTHLLARVRDAVGRALVTKDLATFPTVMSANQEREGAMTSDALGSLGVPHPQTSLKKKREK